MIETRLVVVAAMGSLALFIMIFELVRSRRLKEKYSFLWLLTSAVLLFLSIFWGAIRWLSGLLGIQYPPSVFFLLAFLFLLLIMVQFSVVISRLSDRNKSLAHELSLLKLRVEELESRESR